MERGSKRAQKLGMKSTGKKTARSLQHFKEDLDKLLMLWKALIFAQRNNK
jgi:hypothetical protein